MDRAQKDAEIKFLSDCFVKSPITLCADYRGLTVGESMAFRQELKAQQAFGRVTKNTLARISVKKAFKDAESSEVDKFLEVLNGPSMLVFSETDPVSPAKVVANFAKEHKQLEIKGGWFEGAYLDQAGVQYLSSLPSREELWAQLLNLINAPATQLARLIAAPATQCVQLLEAYRAKLEEKG
ncbi:50S ribosomal protein L10 [Oligoflexia bacterium]|nr:50S ribosomal protein L10 [Oligoflexia bacterium]